MKVKGRWKFSIALVVIILIVFSGLWVWSDYFSEAGRQSRELQANYQKYLDVRSNYETAMKADTYGGNTPEETLGMFIDALKKGDIELASKYFVLREDGSRDPQWLDGLREKEGNGRLKEIIDLLSRAKPAGSSIKNYYGFEVLNNLGEPVADIGLVLNIYSQIWKIESL